MKKGKGKIEKKNDAEMWFPIIFPEVIGTIINLSLTLKLQHDTLSIIYPVQSAKNPPSCFN